MKEAVTKATAVATSDSYSPTVITPKPAVKGKSPAWLYMLIGGAVPVVAWVLVTLLGHSKPPEQPLPTPPKVADVEPPKPAGPLDLTPLYFGPDERPLHYVSA